MKRIIYIILAFFVLIFSNCDEEPEPEFDLSLIPGIYNDCQITYSNSDLFRGEITPGVAIEDLSSRNATITINNVGENIFLFSVKSGLNYSVPDLEITTLPVSILNWAVGIKYLKNDLNYTNYSLNGAGLSGMGYYPPGNNFEVIKFRNEISFHFIIKSSNPDSLYFLDFWGSRLY